MRGRHRALPEARRGRLMMVSNEGFLPRPPRDTVVPVDSQASVGETGFPWPFRRLRSSPTGGAARGAMVVPTSASSSSPSASLSSIVTCRLGLGRAETGRRMPSAPEGSARQNP